LFIETVLPAPIPWPLALFGGKGKGNALISSFYGFHDIDIEYISLPMTAFWDRPYRTFGGGDVLSSGLKPRATFINNTMLTAEIASSVWLVALSDLIGY